MSHDGWAAIISGVYAAHPGTWRRDATAGQLRSVTSLLKEGVPPDSRAELWRAAVGNKARCWPRRVLRLPYSTIPPVSWAKMNGSLNAKGWRSDACRVIWLT